MSAICCAAPSLNLMTAGSTATSSLPVYHHHFSRPMPPPNYSFMPMDGYSSSRMQPLPCHQADHPFTVYGSQQQQQQFLVPNVQQQQASSAASRARRKRLEDALTEAIPAASSGKVSQRIAQLQQSLYASCHSGRIHPATRPLSLDPSKDYSQPLTVDCSIEYDLPRVARPPPGAKPLLLIARRPSLPAVRTVGVSPTRQRQQPQQQRWNTTTTTTHQVLQSSQQFIRPDCVGGYFVMNVAPVSSSSSEDSGRGTDSERASSPVMTRHPSNNNNNNWMTEPWTLLRSAQVNSQQQQQMLKLNHVKTSTLPARDPQHPRPAEAARARGSTDQSVHLQQQQQQQSGCHCCPSRTNQMQQQRWAPYSTVMARHACPAPVALQQQQLQQQQHVENWTRWSDTSTLDHLLTSSSSSSSSTSLSSQSLMAFHI